MRFKLISTRTNKAIFTLIFFLALSQLFFIVPCYGNDPIATFEGGGDKRVLSVSYKLWDVVEKTPTPDFDGNDQVDFSDFLEFVARFGASRGDSNYDAKYEIWMAMGRLDSEIF